MRVLLVEDDTSLAGAVTDGLRKLGWQVSHCRTGGEALGRVAGADVVLLDLGLPDTDGLDVCREIRRSSEVPVIILTARDEETDRVIGLELGADDYLGKPFGIRELIARIRAVTRRTRGDVVEPTRIGTDRIRVDRETREVTVDGRPVELTPREFDILAHLAARPGVVHRRRDLLNEVWGTSWYGSTKTLDVHIASLRRKLGDPALIETVRGVGFRLVP